MFRKMDDVFRRIDRRQALRTMVASAAAAATRVPPRVGQADEPPARTQLGLVIYCCQIRRSMQLRAQPPVDLFEPQRFLQHCRQLGAGGMQVPLGTLDRQAVWQLGREVELAGDFFIEASIRPPADKHDLERFTSEMASASQVGARAVRAVVMPGRRYEYFKSLEQFHKLQQRACRSLELAAPVAEKLRLPLAVENHKDQRIEERIASLEHISSAYVGACVDTGNSIALLEEPLETVAALARWAHAVHLKDQAVQPYRDGFLLGDIALGRGVIDLKQVVPILRRHKPDLRFCLELITRDALKVPVLTDEYWATMPNLPAKRLARMLRLVRDGAAERLETISALSQAEQLAREDANVRQSLVYARKQLAM